MDGGLKSELKRREPSELVRGLEHACELDLGLRVAFPSAMMPPYNLVPSPS